MHFIENREAGEGGGARGGGRGGGRIGAGEDRLVAQHCIDEEIVFNTEVSWNLWKNKPMFFLVKMGFDSIQICYALSLLNTHNSKFTTLFLPIQDLIIE